MKYEEEIVQNQSTLNRKCLTKDMIIRASVSEELIEEPTNSHCSDTFYVGNIKVSTLAPVEWSVLAKL
jgi:hypothetical protein